MAPRSHCYGPRFDHLHLACVFSFCHVKYQASNLPAIYAYPYFVKEGGLIAYGIDPASLHPRAAGYVDRILKGANPAELPVQVPTKYELALNLRTAKALGLDVPWFLQQRADEVIE